MDAAHSPEPPCAMHSAHSFWVKAELEKVHHCCVPAGVPGVVGFLRSHTAEEVYSLGALVITLVPPTGPILGQLRDI